MGRSAISLAVSSVAIIIGLVSGWGAAEWLSLLAGLWVGLFLAWGGVPALRLGEISRKVHLPGGDRRRGARVGRAVRRRHHDVRRDTRHPSSDDYLLGGLRARPGRCEYCRRDRQAAAG